MDFVSDLFGQLTALGPEMLVALIVIVLGYVLRWLTWFPNRMIPIACIVLGGILYPLLAPTPKADLAMRHPMVRLALIGILIGFLAWIGHNKFLKPIEDKLPWLKGLLDNDPDPSAQDQQAKDQMKRTLPIIVILLGCLCSQAQTNQTTTIPDFLGNAWNVMVGQAETNLSVAAYGTYTPSVKKWGGGFAVIRDIPIGGGISTGIGIGVDEYDNNWYGVTAQVGLQASIRPLSNWGGFWTNVVTTPLTYVGLGTPFGSASTTSGQLETIAAVGEAVHIARVAGGDINIIGLYGTRTGLGAAGGVFYGGGASITWKF